MSGSKEDLEKLLQAPYPRIEVKNGVTILARDENVRMPIPPLNNIPATTLFKANLPLATLRDLVLAELRLRTNRIEPCDLTAFEQLSARI